MKGLIYKDFLCLRKNLTTFGLVTFGVVFLAVMFLLSSKYGNVVDVLAELQQETGVEAVITMNVFSIAVFFMMFIPITFSADVAQCFREDARVGFGKVLAGMSLTHGQIVGSRYLTCVLYGAVSTAVSVLAAVIIMLVPAAMELEHLLASVVTYSAGFMTYMSLNLFLIYLLGARKADLVQILPLVIALGGVFFFMSKYGDVSDEVMIEMMADAGDKIGWFLQNGYKVLIPVALVSMLLSYGGSVAVLKCRRRVL